MTTWKEYKKYIKSINPQEKKEIEDIEKLASIIGEIIKQRHNKGISQRELAKICGMPQSSIARIESFETTPKIDTLLKLMQPLGMTLNISYV